MELSELEQSIEANVSPRSISKRKQKITFRNAKMEIVLPMFTGAMGSLICCSLFVILTGILPATTTEPVFVEEPPIEDFLEEINSPFLSTKAEPVPDIVLEYFRNEEYHDWVIDFFTGICSSRDIAMAVLHNADKYNVSPSLAFALSWEESRFNPRAINRHNRDGSIDRGLFQLNNRSFPNLELAAFFDVDINARYGISHIRHCLNVGGNEIAALAIYNAGAGRVASGGTPRVTLNYISRILGNRNKIEDEFSAMLSTEKDRRIALIELERAQAAAAAASNPLHFNRTLRATTP